MTEVNTFSAAVDDTLFRSGRNDRFADAVSFVRMSIRELQTVKGYLFDNDIVEDVIFATAEPFVFTPDLQLQKIWRTMRSVQYPALFAPNGDPIFADYVGIGKRQNQKLYFYYKSGISFVFSGHGGDLTGNTAINIAFYTYSPILTYFSNVAERPATYSLEDNDWSYLTATTTEEEEAARLLVTNWILEKWYDAVVEGALAKLFKTVDDQRARSSFALYSSYKTTLQMAEPRSHFGVQI